MTAQVTAPAAVIRTGAARTGVGAPGAGDDRLDRQGRGTLAAQLVVAGLAACALAQGGYHAPGRLPLLVTLPVAALLVGIVRPEPSPSARWTTRAAAVAGLLGTWALLRGGASADRESGIAASALLGAVALLLVTGRRLPAEARRVVLRGLLGLGAVTAVAGWVGVVWHVDRLAVTQDGMWRAAGTLTYSNAAAALLAVSILPALSLRVARPADRWLTALIALLLVGEAASLSRAGTASLAVGVVVLAICAGWRRVVVAVVAPAGGALVAAAGLYGSVPLDASAGRWAAVLALPLGLSLAAGLAPLQAPRALLAVLLLGAAATTTALVVQGAQVLAMRLSAGGSIRWDANRAAMHAVADHRWWGTGPGAGGVDLAPVGMPFTVMRFVHDEYVQTLLELGVLGLLLLLLLVALLVRAAAAGSRDVARDPLPAGVLAALVAAAVHGGLDFVWHVPVVPLTAVALVAVAWRPATDP
jgi:O-antigen ligase